MKRWISLCLLLVIAHGAQAASFIVNVGGAQLVFTPQTLNVNVGDTVTFINKGGFHNVVADNGSFRCSRGCDGDGMGGNGGASNLNWIAHVTFNKAGTVGYFCEIHGAPGQGMFGTIIVQGANPPPPPPTQAVPATSANVLGLLIGAIMMTALLAFFASRRRSR